MSTRLAEFIKKEGITQAEFAKNCGLPRPMVCQWMSGTRRPGLASALVIEQATGGKIPASYWTTIDVDNCNGTGKRRKATKSA